MEVLGDDEDEAEQGQEARRYRQAAAGEPAVREHRHVEHRMGVRSSHSANAVRTTAATPNPAMVWPLVHPTLGASMMVYTRAVTPIADRTRPAYVDGRGRGVPRRRDEQQPADDRHRRDRHIDQENRTPPEVFEQPASGDRSGGHADAHHGGPQADRLGARYRVGEDVRDQRQGGREDHRGADAHRGASPDQGVRRVHLRGYCGGDRKQREPGTEKTTPTITVAQAAGRQHQTGHDQGVGVDDPLQLRGIGVEFARQRR